MTNAEIERTLSDALANQRKRSLAEVMPLACEVLTTTDNYRTFALAGDVLDRIWIHTSPILQYWRLEHAIYNIFWARIGSIENIKKQLPASSEKSIFWDSMSWIRSLRYINFYNPKLYRYFKEISQLDSKALAKLPRELTGRALDIKNRKLVPRDAFDNRLKSFAELDAMIELSYSCNSIEDARVLIDAIVKPSGSISESDGAFCVECLLRANRNKSVRKYVLRRLHSERFFYSEKHQLLFIEAAAVGVMSDTELNIIRDFIKSLSPTHPELKDTMKLARNNLAAEKFQIATVRQSPIVKSTIKKYLRYRG